MRATGCECHEDQDRNCTTGHDFNHGCASCSFSVLRQRI
jgi:hypothetical protein